MIPKVVYWLRKIWLGLTLTCPNCEQASMFSGLTTMHETCPNCGVRYERRDGESLGGMTILLGLAELISIGGFFIIHAALRPPVFLHMAAWIVFILAFCYIFYRNARGAWASITFLTGGLYADN